MNNMVVNTGSIIGPHHKKSGEPNQDAFAYLQENGFTVIAVADGAGSLKNSQLGANIAAFTTVEEALDELISGTTVEEALHKAVDCAREAVMYRDDWKDLGCTLSVGIITENHWGVAVVGDAFGVVSHDAETHELVHREPDSEYANITELITSKEIHPLYVFGDGEVEAISVSSDGLTNLSVKISEKEAADNFWTPVIRRSLSDEMNIQAFLEHMEEKEKLYDDTTLVIASKKNY